MDVFDSDLEPVEATRFSYLDFLAEAFHEVLVDNAIGGSEKRKYVGYKVALIVGEFVPVGYVLGEVDFLGGPEGGFGLFVFGPDVGVFDREDYKPSGVVTEQGFQLSIEFGLRRVVVNGDFFQLFCVDRKSVV